MSDVWGDIYHEPEEAVGGLEINNFYVAAWPTHLTKLIRLVDSPHQVSIDKEGALSCTCGGPVNPEQVPLGEWVRITHYWGTP